MQRELFKDILGYNEHLSPLLSLLMDEFTSLHHTLLCGPCWLERHMITFS